MPNSYPTAHSVSPTKSTWVFEGYVNSSSYHLRALSCISWLRGVGTFGSCIVLKAVKFSIANPDSQTPASQNQGASSNNSPWSFLPQWHTRLLSWQIWIAKKHLAIGNVSREIFLGRIGEPLPQKHKVSRMTDVKLSPTCVFLGEVEPAALSEF